MRIVIGPSQHYPSWHWCAQDLIPDLKKHHHISTFREYNKLGKVNPDVIMCVKFPPPGDLQLKASKIIYLPIDYFKRKDSIINHSDFLQRCNLIAVHCSRLTDLLKPYCERIEFIEHYDKYVLPNPVDYNPKGMVLWIGQCAYFERVRDWYASEDLHESRSFRLNVLTNRIKKMSLNLRSHPSISLDTWTEKLQRYYFENARAGLDLKGNSFHQQTKPPIKIQQFVASGIPAMVNCSSYSWEYFHERGFNLADPDDTDRWLSRAYWKETRAFVPKLRPAISKANVIQSYLNLIEKA